MLEENQLEIPDTSIEEGFKTFLELIPFQAIQSLLSPIKHILEKRILSKYEIFYNALASGLNDLNKKVNEFYDNPKFIDSLLIVLPMIQRQMTEQKIEALAHGVVSFITREDIDLDKAEKIFRFADEIGLAPIKLLSFFISYKQEVKNIESYHDLYKFYKDRSNIEIHKDEFRFLCQELSSRYLLNIPPGIEETRQVGLLANDSEENTDHIRITEIGAEFINFLNHKKLFI